MSDLIEWYDTGNKPIKNGKYQVKLVKLGKIVVTERYMRHGQWFGGCRPFTDNEVITHYKLIKRGDCEENNSKLE